MDLFQPVGTADRSDRKAGPQIDPGQVAFGDLVRSMFYEGAGGPKCAGHLSRSESPHWLQHTATSHLETAWLKIRCGSCHQVGVGVPEAHSQLAGTGPFVGGAKLEN